MNSLNSTQQIPTTQVPSDLITNANSIPGMPGMPGMGGMGGISQILGIVASIVLFLILVYISWRVCSTVGFWHIFKKSGEKPWKAVIPFYCEYSTFKCFWGKNVFWVWLASNILFGFTFIVFSFSISIFTVIFGLIAIVTLAMLYYRVSKSFNHSIGYFIGLFLIVPVFALILGFEKSNFNKNENSFDFYRKIKKISSQSSKLSKISKLQKLEKVNQLKNSVTDKSASKKEK